MSLQSRVQKLERECGAEGGPCPLCERREERAREPRAAIPGTREALISTMRMNCPRCGLPFVINIVYVEPWGPGGESAIAG